MSNDLVPFSVGNLPTMSEEEFGALENVKGSTKFLPRIQLNTKGKYIDTGKAKPGVWIVPNGDECETLGETIDVLPLASRNKALDMSDTNNIISVFDTEDEEYQRIKKAPKGSHCMWGLSFLVIERSTGALYELYFGNASGRAESDKLKPFLGRGERQPRVATLGIKYRKTPEFSYHVPVVTKCSEPLTEGPDMKTIAEEKEKFLNPPKPEVEAEKETSKRAR